MQQMNMRNILNTKKHIGKILNTDQRVYIVMLQLPEKPTHALVISSDGLPEYLNQAITEVLDTEIAQQQPDLSQALNSRVMPGTNMSVLNALHTAGRLVPISIDSIVLLPTPNHPTPLRLVIEMSGGFVPQPDTAFTKAHPPTPVVDEVAKTPLTPEMTERFNPYEHNAKANRDQVAENNAIGLIKQAESLEAEAMVKRIKAYNMAPSLRPPSPVTSAPAIATAPVVNLGTGDPGAGVVPIGLGNVE
jgi:hypothetical protein